MFVTYIFIYEWNIFINKIIILTCIKYIISDPFPKKERILILGRYEQTPNKKNDPDDDIIKNGIYEVAQTLIFEYMAGGVVPI